MGVSTSTTSKAQVSPALSAEVRALLSSAPEPTLLLQRDGAIVFANASARQLLGAYAGADLHALTTDPAKFQQTCERWLRSSDATPASLEFRIDGGPPRKYRLLGNRLNLSAGSFLCVRLTPSADANVRFAALNQRIYELGREINRRRDAEERLEKQNLALEKQKQLLQAIAQGAELSHILRTLVEMVQQQSPAGATVSILLLQDDGTHLAHAIASDLPPEYSRMIDGLPIGPQAGSCGTAAFTRKSVFVGDILVDPLWENYRDAARASGMRACWSTPILSQDQAVLGTFAVYYKHPFPDISQDQHIVELCRSTAAVAIQRAKLEQRRRVTEHALRQ